MKRWGPWLAVVLASVVTLAACDVQTVNWRNHAYDVTCWHGKVLHATLTSGGAQLSTPGGLVLTQIDTFFYPNAQSPPAPNVVQGDITRDGVADEAVLLDCIYLKPLNVEQPVQDLQIFTSGPKLIAHVPAPRLALEPTWPAARIDEVMFDRGNLVLDVWFGSGGAASCCPTYHEEYTYRWDGHRFQVVSVVPLLTGYFPNPLI